MSKFELRILRGTTDKLQYRTKDVWPYTTVPRFDPRNYSWSKWKDVPIVSDP